MWSGIRRHFIQNLSHFLALIISPFPNGWSTDFSILFSNSWSSSPGYKISQPRLSTKDFFSNAQVIRTSNLLAAFHLLNLLYPHRWTVSSSKVQFPLDQQVHPIKPSWRRLTTINKKSTMFISTIPVLTGVVVLGSLADVAVATVDIFSTRTCWYATFLRI